MLYEKISLDKENSQVYLEAYVADKIEGFTRDAILVIPGGGYYNICSDREGEPIGMAFMPYGFNAFVLHYSVKENSSKTFPTQLIEASKAIKYIKDNAEKYNINPERVFAVGFSAGGHLCGSLATMWNKEEIYKEIDMPYGYNKPTGVMLIYPVISLKHHVFSFKNLLGKEEFTEADHKLVSIDQNVSEDSSPMYIMHTTNDEAADIGNSVALANALVEKRLMFEMHIYPDAPHGVALGNRITKCDCEKWDNPSIAKWVENAAEWAKSIK